MGSSYTAEEAAEMLVKDYDDGEMNSGDSLDETSSLDVEETSESQICRDSDNSFDTSYSGCKMFNKIVTKLWGHPSK